MTDDDPSGVYTADEFAQLEYPPCPVCGTAVELERLDVTTRKHFEDTGERLYMAGLWHCPRDCDPITGERRHHSVTYGSNADGYWLWCSCGCKEDGMTSDQFDAALAEHQVEQ